MTDLVARADDLLGDIDGLLLEQAIGRLVGVDGTINCQCTDATVETSNPWMAHYGDVCELDSKECDEETYTEDSFPERCWAGDAPHWVCIRRGYGRLGLCGPHRGMMLTGSPAPLPITRFMDAITVTTTRNAIVGRSSFVLIIDDDVRVDLSWDDIMTNQAVPSGADLAR